jgi:2-polyprenyl-6-methoxyphenol hydroxylase-like FAD-dependent oxidoreductase
MTEVLIVGAGPTGLLLAAQLARRGVPVRLVDKQDTACGESRAVALHAGSVEMLDRIGLAEEFVARGRRVRAFSLWDGRRRLARIDFGALHSAFGFLLDIPQQETEAILAGYLARLGVQVERSTEVLGVAASADRVEVTARGPGGSTCDITAAYVVGCDGAHSTVRREAGVPFVGHGYPDDWLVADVAVDWDRPPDEVHVVFNPAGRATVCMPLPGDRWRVICYFASDRPDPAGPPTLEEVAELFAARVPGPATVSDASWLARFRTHRRHAARYRAGRVLLAGDAAHVCSPAGGQGMNTGLLEAENLAGKLAAVAAGDARSELLDCYEAERAPVAAQVLRLSHQLVRLSSLSAPWSRAVRGVAVPLLAGLPAFRSRAAHRIAQVDLSRASPTA